MPQSIGKRWVAILIAVLLLVVSAVTMAFFTDRVDHSMQFTTASFSADGYTLKRTAPEGPFCAGEDVTATLKESNTGEDAINSVISMKATWVSPDTALSIFGNANAADNAKLSIDGTDISYKVSTDKKSITFDLPAHVLTAGTKDAARDLTLTIPASFKSTGRIEFTFEKVVVAQDGGGFSETYDRTQLNASKELDYSVRVGWAASSIEAQNGKALMGYLTEKDSVSGKFGIQFEYAFNYNTSPMKDFASKTDAKWSYYKDKADRLTFVEGMTSIGDYAFPDFELVTSLSLPESLVSVGKWSFDNISIPTLTLPAALTNFDTMSFGHINELTEITFNQAAKTDISFPTAGSTTGAFYVDPYVPTKIVGENPIAQGYDWITDQRRVAPVIRSYNYTWSGDRMSQPLDATTLTPDDDSNVDFHTAENRAKIKSVVFQDASGYYAIPDMKPGDAGGLVEKNNNMWDVSAAQNKSVIAWLKDDGTLIIAGDGVKVMANADSDWLFGDMANIETIDAALYDTSNATTMEYWHAFAEPDLRQNEGDWSGDPLPMEVPQRGTKQIVGIQDWDVSKVTSTMDMFYNANRLTSLNLGSWNTKSLKTPNGMFHGCSALTTLDVSGWNTSNVTTLQSIFSHCRGLTALDVAGWDVQKVTDMSFAFSDCGAPVLDLHTWKTNSLTTLEKAFAGAGANTINVTGWNTSKVITMDSAFENTASLGSLDLSTWDTSGVGRGTESDGTVFGTGAFNNMFFRSGAKSINVSGFDFSSLYGPKGNWNGGLYKMFGECKSLTEIVGAETWTNTGKIVELNSTFIDCEKLVTLNVSKWDTSGVTAMSNAFNGCKSLAELDVSKWNVSSCEGYINTFKDCESVKVLDISKWDMTKATPSASQNMFNGCKSLESLTFPTSVNWLATRMAANCPKLTTIEFLSTDASISQRPTAGASLGAFYVAPDAGVTVPVTTFIITHGSGMAQLKDASIYNLADDNRCLPLDLPVQSETLTYTGSEQSPSWNNFDATKMTVSGTTTAVNADTYTAKFTPKTGYAWEDGTTGAKSVTWKIGKAAGSLFVTPTEMTIALNDTTGTITVTRAGDGAITATSDKTSVATVEVNGNKITVTKKDAGTANITVKVAEGTNHKAPAGKTVVVTCKITPELNAKNTWYTGSTAKSAITEIELKDSYTATGNEIESWDASAAQNNTVMAYVVEGTNGKKLILAGNGSGKIVANADSTSAFNGFTALTAFTGLNKLDTSNVTNMQTMFNNLDNIQTLDLSSFNTSKVTNFYSIFGGNDKLTTLNLTGWDTSAAKDMGQMFYVCNALTTINGLSSFNTANVTDMSGMFHGCKAMTSLDLSNFNTAKVKTLSMMFYQCSNLETVKLTSFDTSNVTSLYAMFQYCYKLKAADLSSFNTAKVTNIRSMFGSCKAVESLDLSSFDTSAVTNMSAAFDGCQTLQTVTLGKDFKFVGTDGYLPAPSATYISGADGNWYVAGTDTGYTPTELAAVTRVRAVTYSAIPGTDPGTGGGSGGGGGDIPADLNLAVPEQVGTLTANGSEQSPTWKNYDSSKMTISGTTSAVEAGTYTATFTLNDGYAWFDGTAEDKDVQWTMESGAPMLAEGSSWYKSSVSRKKFTKIELIDSGTPSGTIVEQWNADVDNSGSIKAYITGSSGDYTLTIAGNGSGSIMANPNSGYLFGGDPELEGIQFAVVKDIAGLELLDTSKVTNMSYMFNGCSALTSLDLSGFDTSKVTYMDNMFNGCSALTALDLSGFDTSSVKEMYGMFYMCSALTSLDVSGFDTSQVTSMRNMFRNCTKLKSVTLGKAFKFVGTNGYLPTPSSTYITGADGKWYDTNTGTGYTPEALASVERTEAVTYSAVPNAKILSGVWKFNKGLGLSRYEINENVPFKSAGKTFSSIYVTSKTANLCFDVKNTYLEGTGWTDAAYRLISFNGSHVVTEDFYNWFVENAKPVVTLEGKWKFNETLTFDTEVEATEISYTMDGFTGVILETEYAESGKFPGWKLAVDYNVFSDMYVYGDTGLAETPLGWRNESYRTIAFNGTQYVTKDFYDWFIANAKPWSEDESGAAEKIAVPKQSGTLTYTGSAQSPSWSSYDASKMTMGGTTTGTNAGSYTTTFALNDGFKWADGTTGTKSVIWKIGKATGSVSFSKDSLNIDKNSTTDTLDVTRTGTGAITATSSDTSVATVTVNGTKVTVTKVGDGTATITIKVAADANYKEASKTCSVTCVGIPTLAYGSTWYKGSTDKASVTKIQIKDSYTPSGAAAESWNADARNSGSIKAYVEGTTLTIAGNGTGKIKANALSWSVFNGFSSATAITGLDLMDTSNALTMEAMFYGCKALTALDVSKFDTSNVTSMRAMFYECENLTSLNVSKFDTAAVTNVEAMFQGCKALTAVGDVSGWNTAKVTSMYQVFYGCEKLAALDLSGWNTINVTNMQAMFLDCTSLTSVGDLSGWNTAKVTEMALLFGNCEKLASLDVSKFNTAAVTNMNAMFFNCSALTTLDVSSFDTAKTTNLAAMFSGCVSLTSLDVSNWNTSNVTTMEATFQSCKKLTTMGDVSGWDTSKVTNMREMFCQCNLITSVDVTNWKTGNVTNMNGIFSNCEKLTSVGDLSGWDTSSATDMGWIFNSCFKLTGMGDISQWDTSNATKMNCLFATCESLTELDLSGWDTSKVTDMNNIFGGYEHEQLEEGEIAGACVLLRKITLGAKFKFVGTDSYLPEPDSRYISGADGKWYAGSTGYTPAELAGLSRTEAVTYVAVKGTKTMSILSGDNAVSGYSISE